LKKKRDRVEETGPHEEYAWNKIDESDARPDLEFLNHVEPKDVFLPHSTVVLKARPADIFWNFEV